MSDAVTMDKIVSLCKRRGFVFPSSEIYGGLGSSYDYGHYGVLLKENVKARWLEAMVRERDDIGALDSSIIATVVAAMAAIATTRTAPYRGLTFKYAFINDLPSGNVLSAGLVLTVPTGRSFTPCAMPVSGQSRYIWMALAAVETSTTDPPSRP